MEWRQQYHWIARDAACRGADQPQVPTGDVLMGWTRAVACHLQRVGIRLEATLWDASVQPELARQRLTDGSGGAYVVV